MAPDGTLNVAPMGPRLGADPRRFLLRPYRTSTTYRNLKATGEGVLHITDDVLLIARAAIGLLPEPPTRPASVVRGRILETTGRHHEIRVVELDDRSDRTSILVESVAEGRNGDLFGLNRAKHAVVEAAILATRLDFLPPAEVMASYRQLAVLVEKTGGLDERLAFGVLAEHALRAVRLGGVEADDRPDDFAS